VRSRRQGWGECRVYAASPAQTGYDDGWYVGPGGQEHTDDRG
jgi:hypothetical protein